jgi:hypothetical protein
MGNDVILQGNKLVQTNEDYIVTGTATVIFTASEQHSSYQTGSHLRAALIISKNPQTNKQTSGNWDPCTLY